MIIEVPYVIIPLLPSKLTLIIFALAGVRAEFNYL